MSPRELHQAGAKQYTGIWAFHQDCARCGVLLADLGADGKTVTGIRGAYPMGAVIERAPTFQALTLADYLPTCTPSEVAR